MADLSTLRQSYQAALAEQMKQGLRGVQDIYGQRGTTGSGAESLAVGELGRQYGLGTAQNELAIQQLEQQGSQFGQTLAEQVAARQQQGSQFGQQLQQQGSQFGQTLAEQVAARQQQGSQFGQQLQQQGSQFGQTLAEQVAARQQQGSQFGQQLQQQGSQFGQSLGLQQQQLAQQGQLSREQLYGGTNFNGGTLAGQEFTAGQVEQQQMNQVAQQVGFNNATEMQIYQANPEMARHQGIFANEDKTEIQRLVNEGSSGDQWLRDHFGLSRQQAINLIQSGFPRSSAMRAF